MGAAVADAGVPSADSVGSWGNRNISKADVRELQDLRDCYLHSALPLRSCEVPVTGPKSVCPILGEAQTQNIRVWGKGSFID